ncbi:hypothetical protein CSHISOI_10497 [Colletotrichum shisoi]|uniref:Uncharacterized protein n=1 Tax=Colletotrichum shisoi TaxID=2078593 RepID=A0A5Q4BDU7_9PEZI|nr:hypothetical protein CSHISOI_10497 [Colletotrichum shisoi]
MQFVHTWPPFLVSPLAHAEALDVWSSLLRPSIEPPIMFTLPRRSRIPRRLEYTRGPPSRSGAQMRRIERGGMWCREPTRSWLSPPS